MRRFQRLALALFASLLAAACGGGDNDAETQQPTPKVDCKANPTACK